MKTPSNNSQSKSQIKAKTHGNRGAAGLRDKGTAGKRDVGKEGHKGQKGWMKPAGAVRISTIQEAIAESLTDKHGRQTSIFVYCRALVAFEITTGIKLARNDLEGAFVSWWASAASSLPDGADFSEYRQDFLQLFVCVKTPLGSNPLTLAIQQADASPTPPEAAHYTSPRIKRLASVCYQLQVIAGDAPFFIGVRDAAGIIGSKKPAQGGFFLKGLVNDGILEVVQKGQAGGNIATRYRYNFKQ